MKLPIRIAEKHHAEISAFCDARQEIVTFGRVSLALVLRLASTFEHKIFHVAKLHHSTAIGATGSALVLPVLGGRRAGAVHTVNRVQLSYQTYGVYLDSVELEAFKVPDGGRNPLMASKLEVTLTPEQTALAGGEFLSQFKTAGDHTAVVGFHDFSRSPKAEKPLWAHMV